MHSIKLLFITLFMYITLAEEVSNKKQDELSVQGGHESHAEDDLMKAESSPDVLEHKAYQVPHQGPGGPLQSGHHNYFPGGHEGPGYLQLPQGLRPGILHGAGLSTRPFGQGGGYALASAPQPVYPGQGQGLPAENAIEYGPAEVGQGGAVEYAYTAYEPAGSHEIADQQQGPPQQKPPQPPPPQQQNNGPQASYDQQNQVQPSNEPWPLPAPEMPKISHLDVKCEKNLMKVAIEFDKPFNGIIFSKNHYSHSNCVHLPAGSNKNSVYFDVSINTCGTVGNTQNGLYGYGLTSGSGSFFENTIVIQYDPQVQEVWDQARKLRCTWHDQYEKSVTFRPFPVDMLDVVRADFAGDNVGCWMQIQVGKGPWASEVAGIVKIGQTMTMVLAIKDEENKFDMLVRNCIAHDGKRAPIELVDSNGCIARPKLMSRFTKIKNFGSSATVLSYAHFQAFKFPDSMEVHFQCTIQICRNQCPEQCNSNPVLPGLVENVEGDQIHHVSDSYSSGNQYNGGAKPRQERDLSEQYKNLLNGAYSLDSTEVGLNRIIQVVSTGDLAFSVGSNETLPTFDSISEKLSSDDVICMSATGFAAGVVVLISVLVISCLISVFLCLRQRAADQLKNSNLNSNSNFPISYEIRSFPRKQAPPLPNCKV